MMYPLRTGEKRILERTNGSGEKEQVLQEEWLIPNNGTYDTEWKDIPIVVEQK